MPTNITDSDTFTDPIQGPADADAQAAASYNLGFQGLANRTRNLRNDVDELRGRFFGGFTKRLGVFRGRPEVYDAFTFNDDGDEAQSEANQAEFIWDVTELLPRGGANAARIEYVRVLVDPGAARAGNNRMIVELSRTNYGSLGSPSVVATAIASQRDNTTAALQWIEIDLSGAPHSIVSADTYKVVVGCGNDSGTSKDKIYAVELDISESAA